MKISKTIQRMVVFCVIACLFLLQPMTAYAVTAGDGTYTWPVSTSYGISNAYTTSHGGFDLGSPIGSAVYAVADGTVIRATDYGCQGSHGSVSSGACPLGSSCQAVIQTGKSHGSYANWIIIDHGNSVYSLYAHLKTGTFTVSTGQTVKQGQQIACSGNAGNTHGTTGAHLHFELRMGGNSQSYSVNPSSYLTKTNVTPNLKGTPADLGTDFTAPILNLAAWKPIENSYTESDKPPVRMQTENGKANQLWYFSRQSDGSYMISSCQDGKYLDVRDAGTGTGVVIQTCENSGSDAQKWYLYENSGGYIIESKLSGYVLDMVNNDSTSGNTLQTWESNGTSAQIWAIYRGDECKLKGQTLSVATGDSKTNTKFTWTEAYGESQYDVKIWKGTAWDGDAYHIEWGASSGFTLTLPAGTYQAYVDASNYYNCEMSNLVTFTVKEHTCSNTSKVTNPTCTAQGYTTYTCSVCGNVTKGNYTNALGHNYSYKVKTSPTTATTGTLTGTCSRCSGTTSVTLPKLSTTNYTYKVVKAATCTAAGTGRYTWNTTTYGTFYFDVSIAKTSHNYSYKATTAPTTTATGVLTGTCSSCSGTTTVTLPKLSTTDYTYKVVTAATCTATGTGRYTWNNTAYGTLCFDVVIAKTNHFELIVPGKTASCTDSGLTDGKMCYVCGTVTLAQQTIEATGHKEVTVPGKAATCTQDGLTDGKKCSVCGTVTLAQQTITAIGHKEITVAGTPATCTASGLSDAKYCTVCESYTQEMETIPAKGHNWNSGVQTGNVMTYTCTVCGNTRTEDIPTPEHKHQYVSTVVPPTCEDKGCSEYTCSCGDSYRDNETAALGHTYTDDQDADCNTCGEKREITDPSRPEVTSVPMYRMYDPNSGEHFYTGAELERDFLVEAGWHYEGVGFNFPEEGEPVYRLYEPVYGEHLYTMDEAEVDKLVSWGWNVEGVAFNSAGTDEVPQYRLHNPNAKRGGYHFTGSVEERDFLISIGWINEGIGWYSCAE